VAENILVTFLDRAHSLFNLSQQTKSQGQKNTALPLGRGFLS